MKKRTKIFFVSCAILAVVLLAAGTYLKEPILTAIAGGLIGGCICRLIDKYSD